VVCLNYNYEMAIRLTIPAVRIAVSSTLSKKYSMSETDIAKNLGIAQAAVSKYLSGNYSNKIGAIAKFIESKDMEMEIVDAILKEKSKNLGNMIDKVASNKNVLDFALSQL
jgi:predicted transcriptional regulator